MKHASWMVAVGAAVTCQIACADLPQIFDRIPGDAAVVVMMPAIDDLKEAISGIEGFAGEGAVELGELTAMVDQLQGLDTTRPAAIYFPTVAGEFDMSGEPLMVALMPLADFDAFVGQFDAQNVDGVSEFSIEGEPAYAINLGGGYAALSPIREAVESYDAGNGARAAHEARLGAVASAAAGNADLFIAADMTVFSEQIQEGVQSFADNMAMVGAMGGGDMTAQIAMVKALGQRLVNDGQAGFLAIDMSADGLSAGFGLQFKGDSETAAFLTESGDAARLTSRLPAKDFLFAFGADMSKPGLRHLNNALTGAMVSSMPGMDMLMKDTKGFAFVMGESPGGIMGGSLFGATTSYLEVGDPASHLAGMKAGLEALDGESVEGSTYKTSYTSGASSVDGASLDAWSVQVSLDPAMGQQAMMAMGMLFGAAGGPGGYVAATDNGLVLTMSKNTELAGQSIKAAKSGEGLGASELVKGVASHLPEGRSAELYIGVGNLMDMAMMFMTMQMGPMDIEIPEDLPPVGFGIATQGGGVEFRGFAPAGVLKLIAEVGAAVEEAQGAAPGPPEGGGGPRF